MRILMTGSAYFTNRKIVELGLKAAQGSTPNSDTYLAQGGCCGADEIAAEVATEWYGADHVTEFIPDWRRYKKTAGMVRNQTMVDVFKPDVGVGFFQRGAGNVGTMDCVMRMLKAGITVHIYTAPEEEMARFPDDE